MSPAPRTLAQAIERVCTIEEAGAPFPGLSDAIAELGKARDRLDGLEEARAVVDLRDKAYARALELEARSGPGIANPNRANLTRHDRTLAIAAFLAPAWAELEDPLGPTEGLAESEAAQAAAEALADERLDALNDATAELLETQGKLADLRALRDSDVELAVWGENLGRMRATDVDAATAIIQRHLTDRSATAQVADDARRNVEAVLAGVRLDLDATTAELKASIERNDPILKLAAERAERITELEAELMEVQDRNRELLADRLEHARASAEAIRRADDLDDAALITAVFRRLAEAQAAGRYVELYQNSIAIDVTDIDVTDEEHAALVRLGIKPDPAEDA